MPIIKHIPIYSAPKRLLAYVANAKKTEKTLVTGLNCSENFSETYEDMKLNFEMYANERFFKRSIKTETAETEKQKIRLHHYIQSFKPGEVTPEEAHRIGVEWAEKVFGKNHMVLCATHIDRQHIHNHFAVLPYDLDGKHWHANKTTLKMCREISDKIALAHGLEIIEKPKYKAVHKYGENKARKEGTSWKQKLCDDIDEIILNPKVLSVDDLAKELERQGYTVRKGKYLSVKAKPDRKAIRTYRLGDGYSLEHLEYRIANKNQEMPLAAVLRYTGLQREYALCIRQIQIQLYRRPEQDRLHCATYGEVLKTSELLRFLSSHKIDSAEDFRKTAADADDEIEDLKNRKADLIHKIADEEKLIGDIPKYFEILERKPLLAKDVRELSKYSYIKDAGVRFPEDENIRKEVLADLKKQLDETENRLSVSIERGKEFHAYLKIYEDRAKSDYDILLEQAKAEIENLRKAEEQEKQKEEISEQQRNERTSSTAR